MRGGSSEFETRKPSSAATSAPGRLGVGTHASVLPALSVASLVGFGAVVAATPAFAVVRDWVLGIGGGPLVSLAASKYRRLGRAHKSRTAILKCRPSYG